MKRMKAEEFRMRYKHAGEMIDGSDVGKLEECKLMLRLLCEERLRNLEEAEEA